MESSEASSKAPAAASRVTQAAQVSALVDGDMDPAALRACIAQLARGEGRQEWDLYHQIGDVMRSAHPGPAISADFGARFAERFASEPVLLPPRRNLLARLGAWPTTVAALAAAGVGFFIAPSMMRDVVPSQPVASLAAAKQLQTSVSAKTATAESGTPLAQQARIDGDDTLDYIALHHRAHPSLYGAAPAVGPAVFETASHR